MSKFALGLDFGTESARAVLVDVATGEIVATAVEPYPDGVIDERLPGGSVALAPDWALQNSSDWLTTLEATVKVVVNQVEVTAEDIIGIGIDFTACTVVPTDAAGMPLHTLDTYRDRPHAWVKLRTAGGTKLTHTVNCVAFDLGAESGRAVIGRFDGERLVLEEVHRFPNGPVRLLDNLHWDVLRLFTEIKHGLAKAIREHGSEPVSLGLDTWGVGFAPLDEQGAGRQSLPLP